MQKLKKNCRFLLTGSLFMICEIKIRPPVTISQVSYVIIRKNNVESVTLSRTLRKICFKEGNFKRFDLNVEVTELYLVLNCRFFLVVFQYVKSIKIKQEKDAAFFFLSKQHYSQPVKASELGLELQYRCSCIQSFIKDVVFAIYRNLLFFHDFENWIFSCRFCIENTRLSIKSP